MSLDFELIEAAKQGNFNGVKDLIHRRANVHAQDSNNASSMHFAAKGGYKSIVELLVRYGGKIEAKDKDGKTPLDLATQNNHTEVVNFLQGPAKLSQELLTLQGEENLGKIKSLIARGADVNIRDKNSYTLLMRENTSYNVAKFLVENGADVNAKNMIDDFTALHQAARWNYDSSLVEFLLERGADVDAKTRYANYTPLHFAAEYERVKGIQTLIKHGGKINAKSVDGETPLHYVLGSYHKSYMYLPSLDTVKLLVKYGTNIEDKNKDGKTPLDLATENNRIKTEVVNFLQGPAKLYSKLLNAAEQGNLNEVKSLIEQGVDIEAQNENGETSIHVAAAKGFSDVVLYFIDEKNVDLNVKNRGNRTILHSAAGGGSLNVVEKLIEKKANIEARDKDGQVPLHLAAEEGHLNVVEKLIEKKADVNAKNNNGLTPLDLAEQNNRSEVIKFFVRKFANDNKLTPLHWAIEHRGLRTIELFVDGVGSINAQADNNHYNGARPLHLAAEKGRTDVAELLIRKEADVNAADSRAWTPLHTAANGNKLEVAQLLLNNRADVNAKNNRGWTPLHVAAERGSLDVIKLLACSNGVEVNAKSSSEENTPLHIAAEGGQLEVVKFLVCNKANSNAVNQLNKKPSDLASQHNKTDVVEFLASISTCSPKLTCTSPSGRTRREIHKNVPAMQIADKNVRYEYSQIHHGQGNTIAMPEVNSTLVGDATMLLEVIARKLTGKKYVSPSEFPLSKDQYLERKVEQIDQSVKKALSKFSKVAEEPSTYFNSSISVQTMKQGPTK